MATDFPLFTVEQVLQATKGALLSPTAVKMFQGLTTDSRQVSDGNLFIALKGDNFDGHDFVATALDNGARGLLIHDEAKIKIVPGAEKAVVIKVNNTLQALGDLAGAYRRSFSIPVIGLTGSSGKTTTKEMMAEIIGRVKKVLSTRGNLNNLIGLPLTIFSLNQEHELAILEMGTNTRGEIKRLTEIAVPDVGLITNIGPAHLAGFGSIDVVREEKGDLFFNMAPTGTAIINIDDEAVRLVAEKWNGKRVTFGMSLDADVTAKNIEKIGIRGVRFNLLIGDKADKIEIKIVGLHHVYNALAAAAAAWAVGVDYRTILEGLASFQPLDGRMKIIKLQNCAYVLDDSYNANPASVREALMSLKDLKNNHHVYAFLGDMMELGEQSEEMHRKIGILMATIGVSCAFLKGDYAGATAAGAKEGGMTAKNIFFLSPDEDGMNYLQKHLKKNDWVLVKGSHRMKMAKIVDAICTLFGRYKSGA